MKRLAVVTLIAFLAVLAGGWHWSAAHTEQPGKPPTYCGINYVTWKFVSPTSGATTYYLEEYQFGAIDHRTYNTYVRKLNPVGGYYWSYIHQHIRNCAYAL